MNIGGQNYTNFPAVRLRGSASLRIAATGGEATFSIDHLEADRAYTFPDKSGRFPIMGTFAIQLPAIAAGTSTQSTIATVTGIRTEDGLGVWLNRGVTAGYGEMNSITSGGTARILAYSSPGAGNITLTFFNYGVATGYVELVYSYVAVR